MPVLHSLRTGWAQQRSASSENRTFCLEDSELRVSCGSGCRAIFIICRKHKEGKVQDGGIIREDS